jgi:hypothetical protein
VAEISIADDGLGTNTLTLSGVDAISFEIQGNSLYLKAGEVLDFETKSSFGVAVTASDASVVGSNPVFAGYTLDVTDINELKNNCPNDRFKLDADGDGMPDAIETALGFKSNVKDNDVFTNDMLFVRQLYRDLMGREADDFGDKVGLAYWQNAMAAGMSRGAVVQGFIETPEFAKNAGSIVLLYHAILGRSPDFCGFNNWMNQANDGMSAEGIGKHLLDSTEFGQAWESLSNTAFVDLLYQTVFDRKAEQVGHDYWLNQLVQGVERSAVLGRIVQSPEFLSMTVNVVPVDMLYLGLLDRAPDTSGWENWMSNYAQGKFAEVSDFFEWAQTSTLEYHDRFLPHVVPVIETIGVSTMMDSAV